MLAIPQGLLCKGHDAMLDDIDGKNVEHSRKEVYVRPSSAICESSRTHRFQLISSQNSFPETTCMVSAVNRRILVCRRNPKVQKPEHPRNRVPVGSGPLYLSIMDNCIHHMNGRRKRKQKLN